MGNKSQSSSGDGTGGSFSVEQEYDRFFCDKLRRAIRDDFDAYPGGAPTYLAHLLKTVAEDGPPGLDVDVFSVEDFRNFLKGAKPWKLRLRLMDIYIQIIKPDLRKTFLVNNYIRHIGDVFGDFFESPSLDKASRETVIQRLIGVYKIRTTEDEYQELKGKFDDRYFAIRRSQSNKYLFCYEFNAKGKGTYSVSSSENYKLVSGICIPAPSTSLVLMRDFRYRNRHVGKVASVTQDDSTTQPNHRAEIIKNIKDATYDGRFFQIRIVSTNSSDEPGYWTGLYRDVYEFDFIPSLSKYWINCTGIRVTDGIELRRVNETIDSFGNVF